MVPVVALWGLAMIICSGFALFLAGRRGRNAQNWAFWTFLFPPVLALLYVLPKRVAPIRVRAKIDAEDLHRIVSK